MKRFPNQISDFGRLRDALAVISAMNIEGALDPASDSDLGYRLVRLRKINFRSFPADATDQQLEARIAQEKLKEPSNQSPLTIARDLRRILRLLEWLDQDAALTERGEALLQSEPTSYDEQSRFVAGLLRLEATDDDGNTHHPIRALLRLLSIHSSFHREGLELALAPLNDSNEEFERIAPLYDLSREERMSALGISTSTRDNAVKILPKWAVTAGLVVEVDGEYSLSQDGWAVLGREPVQAASVIKRRRGRRTTAGRKVTGSTVASRSRTSPPRTLSPEEQARAAARLGERTTSHQALVKRVYDRIGDGLGDIFEDEFSYDLLWVPERSTHGAFLFEMKSITGETDAYARVRHAVGQLSYYEYFYVKPSTGGRTITRVAAFDSDIPEPLIEYLNHEKVAALKSVDGEEVAALNELGQWALDVIQATQDGTWLAPRTQA